MSRLRALLLQCHRRSTRHSAVHRPPLDRPAQPNPTPWWPAGCRADGWATPRACTRRFSGPKPKGGIVSLLSPHPNQRTRAVCPGGQHHVPYWLAILQASRRQWGVCAGGWGVYGCTPRLAGWTASDWAVMPASPPTCLRPKSQALLRGSPALVYHALQ